MRTLLFAPIILALALLTSHVHSLEDKHQQSSVAFAQHIDKMKQLKTSQKDVQPTKKASKKKVPKPAPKPQTSVKQPVFKPSNTCIGWLKTAGVTDIENAHALIMRESGCRPDAINPTSGACGIPQSLPCSKLGGTTDPVEQIKWMDDYVKARYGSWASANDFQMSNGWY